MQQQQVGSCQLVSRQVVGRQLVGRSSRQEQLVGVVGRQQVGVVGRQQVGVVLSTQVVSWQYLALRQVVGSSRFSNKQKVVLFGMVHLRNGQRALLSVGKGQVDQSCSSYCCFCSSFRNICPQKAVLNFYLKFDDLHKSTNSNQIIGLLLLENLSPICAITRHKCN